MTRRSILTAITLTCLVSVPRLEAAVEYLRDVKPILAARCFACHGALQQKGELRVDTVGLLREGGNNGPAVVPGKSTESLLVAHLTAKDGKRRMPPTSEGEGLSAAQIELIRSWIDQGAVGPADEKPEADPKDHWAFRSPTRPDVPAVKSPTRVRNPIDAFLQAEMEKRGLTPAAPADRRSWLRRVSLDLIGLPPTRQEQEAFLADESPTAYEKVVDRLLASPQYGERWGRHWMDVWRYSDWWGLGAEVRNSQKHIWHWRDWIIESLNQDRGHDQMVREMLAADELYPNDLDRLRATGYLARQYFKFNRTTWLDGAVEHTAKAFLGLTLNCARCHDHKYDPIAQLDYYRFRAFFEPYQIRTEMVPGETDFEKDGIPRAFDCNLDAPTYRFVRGDEKQPIKDRPVPPGLPRLLLNGKLEIQPVTLPVEAHSPGLRAFVLETHLQQAEARVAAARSSLQQAKAALVQVEKSKTETTAEPEESLPGKVIFRDDFSGPKPEIWETVGGKWKHEKGRLLQEQPDGRRSILRAKQGPPTDFEARFKFVITGGDPYRSVGIAFDVAGDNEVLVYASAQGGGPKVHVTYQQNGQHVYPKEGLLPHAVKVGEPLELTVRARGPLLNVAVNGEHRIAYRLPVPRKTGRLELITYTATAEFLAFDLLTLAEGTKLLEPGKTPAKQAMPLEQARAAVTVAEKTLAAAEAQVPSLQARAAADRAKFQTPPDATARELAGKAARAEKQAALAAAEEALARAELDQLQAELAKKTAATQKRTAAVNALAAARKALENPGESYTSLRGALKTLESNLENEASRSKPFPTSSTGRRSALARWITDPKNPLTARVAVNHIWTRHFGRPLVPTVFDFGRKGTPPTHPELLDWLAVEFLEHGWSHKHLHRLIVQSDTYRRMSSPIGEDANRSADSENHWYWRMNPVRMEAQVVRDSLLRLAGDLDLKLGGPSVPVSDTTSRRRSLYYVHSHNEHNKFLSTFDDADVLECYRRVESIVPQQALSLSNSGLALTAAGKINERLHKELGDVSDAEFVRAAFEAVLSSSPTAAEQKECETALVELKTSLRGQAEVDRRARRDLVLALVNHNDFITIR